MKVDFKWLVVPSVLTLILTLVRMWGELSGWSPTWFGVEPGGTSAPQVVDQPPPAPSFFGIFWLMPLMGIYLAWRLRGAGIAPAHKGRALLFPLLGFALMVVPFVILIRMQEYEDGDPVKTVMFPIGVAIIGVVAWVGAIVAKRGWPELFRLTCAYGFAARVPIVIITFILVPLDTGTHYEKLAPFAPDGIPVVVRSALLSYAQLTLWIPLTIFFGMITGAITAAVLPRPTVM